MRPCCVRSCGDKTAPRHAFPRNNRLRSIWLERVNNSKLKNDISFLKSYVVCENHFHSSSIERRGKLKPYAVPVLHLPDYIEESPEANCFSYSPIFKPKGTPENIRVMLNTPGSSMVDIPELKVKTPEKTYGKTIKRKLDFELVFDDSAICEPGPSTSTFSISEPVASSGDICVADVPIPPESETVPQVPMLVHTKQIIRRRRFQDNLKALKTIDKKSKRMSTLGRMRMFQKNQYLLKYLRGVNDTTLQFFQSQLRNQGVQPQGRRYTLDDKAFALCLLKQSGKAYRFLSSVFSFPSTKLLTTSLNKIPFLAGLNDIIFDHLSEVSKNMKDVDKICVLMFDEISLEPGLQYNKKLDFVQGFVDFGGEYREAVFADHANVFMIKGVKTKWKQPIMFTFCQSSTSTAHLVRLLKEVIRKLREIGMIVVATICDQGATNVAAINSLLRDTNAYCIKNNIENRFQGYLIDGIEVVHIYDCPHLIKGVRNGLLVRNLHYIQAGKVKVASWSHILQLYKLDQKQGPYSQVYKLTDEHVLNNKIRRMKVKMATQVFSHSVATAMYSRAVVSKELSPSSEYYLDPNACDTADVLMFFDKLFDSVNSNSIYPPPGKPLRRAVSENSAHVAFWQSAITILESMHFKETKSSKEIRIPSLKNWVFSLRGFIYLSKKLLPTLKYLPLRVFNQDPLENFFSQVRSHSVKNPTCSVFVNTYKSLIVNNLTGARCVGGNCEEDETTGPLENFKHLMDTDVTIMIPCVPVNKTVITPNPTLVKDFATPYVAGVIGNKFLKQLPCTSCKSLLTTREDLPENLFIKEKEYEGCELVHPSSVLTNFVKTTSDKILKIIPRVLPVYGVTDCILKEIVGGMPSDILCDEHTDYINILFKIMDIVFFNYLKKSNNVLKGRDSRIINSDLIMKAAHKVYLKKHKKK